MPDWDRASLREALLARGAQYLNASGVTVPNDLIQEAVEELTLEHTWEWRRVVVESTLPAEIPDLGTIEGVLDSTGITLTPAQIGALRDRYGHLDQTGTARFYYRVHRDLKTYPVSSDTFTVDHYSTWGWLSSEGAREQQASGDGSVPACPPEHRDLLLLLCQQRVHALNGDVDLQAAKRQEYETRLEEIRSDRDQVDELVMMEITQGEWA